MNFINCKTKIQRRWCSFYKIAIYGYIYYDLHSEEILNEDNENYIKPKKEYLIKEYDNEDNKKKILWYCWWYYI